LSDQRASASATGGRVAGRNKAAPAGVIETKLVPPPVRPGIVARSGLLERLAGAAASPVVGVFAPAGDGKTTLLAQLIAREQRPVAWVSLDEGDNDPVVLLLHVAVAIDRVLPLASEIFATLASPGPS
jgi:LuxR family maltose regulon positive regulatory protein